MPTSLRPEADAAADRPVADEDAAADAAGKCWRSDTLAKRLFVWLWVSLVVSHVVAIATTHAVFGSPHQAVLANLPVLPALPPTPVLHDSPQQIGQQIGQHIGQQISRPLGQQPPPPSEPAPAQPASPQAGPAPRHDAPAAVASGATVLSDAGPPPLPLPHLLLDYALRLLLLAGFAWAGARWLSRPMAQLSQAARRLAAAPGSAAPPQLDERGMAEVRLSARAFNRMAQRLTAHVRERELTMAAISHDLRTPLTRMRLRLERLRGHSAAQACIADLREMDALIGQVLALLRQEQAAEAAQTLDLSALLQALADDRAEQGARISLRVDLPAGSVATLQAPPLLLRRLLDNLVDNAIRHGGQADLWLARADARHWVIGVDDRGPGICDTQLQQALQPWRQLTPRADSARGGSGLGLYIADQLARQIGATLRLANRAEGGLRASLTLPAPHKP